MATLVETAEEIVEELEQNDDAIRPEVGRQDPHGIEITVLYDDQTLPSGFLSFVGGRADLRVEGVRHDPGRLELTILV